MGRSDPLGNTTQKSVQTFLVFSSFPSLLILRNSYLRPSTATFRTFGPDVGFLLQIFCKSTFALASSRSLFLLLLLLLLLLPSPAVSLTSPSFPGSLCAAKHYQMLSFNARLSFNLSPSLSLSLCLSLLPPSSSSSKKIRQEVGPSGMERKNIEKI